MKQTVYFDQFRAAFHSMDRANQFSYEGSRTLFDYLEQYEEDTGEQLELDVIALCCDFAEDTPENIAEYYNVEIDEGVAVVDAVRTFLKYEGAYIGMGGKLSDNRTMIVYRNL